jgi:murein DD-endopeptidase MepM/ murein hydrolase activator NlpD
VTAKSMARIIGLSALAALMVSCGGAEAPTDAQVTKKPAPPVQPTPQRQLPAAIGQFKLNRSPTQGTLVLGYVPTGTQRLVANGQDIPVAPDGRFVIGLGRDHDATLTIAAYHSNGQAITERLNVAKRAWRIESIKTVKRQPQPDAEFQARRPGEFAQMNAARETKVTSDGWRQSFIWPVKGRISGLFGSQRIYAGEPGSPHSGVDVARPSGTPYVAPADGVVILAVQSPFTLEGNLLLVSHGMGVESSFLHSSKLYVKTGDVVRQGQPLGEIGTTGRSSGPHLHWGMRWRQERIDPMPLAGPM